MTLRLAIAVVLATGSMVFQTFDYLKSSPETVSSAIERRTDAQLALETGNSLLAIVAEILKHVAKRVTETVQYVADSIANFRIGLSDSTQMDKEGKEKKKFRVRNKPKPSQKTTNGETILKGNSRSYWENGLIGELLQDLEERWDEIKEHGQRIFQELNLFKNSELAALLWSMLTSLDYIIFFFGIIAPLLLPRLWPFMGLTFYRGVCSVQWILGFRDTELQRNLGWIPEENSKERSVEPALHGDDEKLLQEREENFQHTEGEALLTAPIPDPPHSPAAITEIAANATQQSQPLQSPDLASIEELRARAQARIESRRKSLAYKRVHAATSSKYENIQDLRRRAAPPPDAEATVRGVIAEVEQRRRRREETMFPSKREPNDAVDSTTELNDTEIWIRNTEYDLDDDEEARRVKELMEGSNYLGRQEMTRPFAGDGDEEPLDLAEYHREGIRQRSLVPIGSRGDKLLSDSEEADREDEDPAARDTFASKTESKI